MKKEQLEVISNLVQEKLGNGYVVAPDIRIKNNNVTHYGIMIKEKDDNIGATIYVGEEQQSWEMEEIAEHICHAFENIGPAGAEVRNIASIVFDKDEVLRRVKYAVINKEKNSEMLMHVPYKEFLDLAVIYKVYNEVAEGTATINVTNELLKILGLELAELDAAAVVNSLREKVDVMPLSELFQELVEEETDCPMWIVRGDESGAAVVTNPILFKRLAEKWKTDFVVFPSSIHEVIAYKIDDLNDKDAINALKQMVLDINTHDVMEEEVLSNNVYYYDKESGKLKIA